MRATVPADLPSHIAEGRFAPEDALSVAVQGGVCGGPLGVGDHQLALSSFADARLAFSPFVLTAPTCEGQK